MSSQSGKDNSHMVKRKHILLFVAAIFLLYLLRCRSGTVKIAPTTNDAYMLLQRREADYERLHGHQHLHDISEISLQNSEILPNQSYFTAATTSTYSLNMTEICEVLETDRCVPKLQHSNTEFYCIPSKQLMTCVIPKNMSTLMRAIMCYLSDPKAFINAGRKITKELFGTRFCKGRENSFLGSHMAEHSARVINATVDEIMNQFRPFAMVRDPVDKFLSAYVDKCVRDLRRPSSPENTIICNNCGKNISCFIINEYNRLLTAKGWSFGTFEDLHFLPQSWECNFREYLAHYELIHYDSTNVNEVVTRLSNVLRTRGVPFVDIAYLRDELRDEKTSHKTANSPARQFYETRLRGSPFLMELVVRMYYWDFLLFNFSLPEIKF